MAKLHTDILFKARVEDLLYYPYRNIMLVRKISGFTKETRNTQPKYENCSKAANEFGHVSSLCKQVRLALSGILPQQNNLAVVNSLTKKMRKVIEHDTINPRGERQLATALVTDKGRQLLKDYDFNPNAIIAFDYSYNEDSLVVKTKKVVFPKGIKQIGFRVHQFAFDFATGEHLLVSGEWLIENKNLSLAIPALPKATGSYFILLEAQFYEIVNGVYTPIITDAGKSVIVV